MKEFAKQHLIDPELCIRCHTCEEACPVGLVVEPPEDCPVTGSTIIKKESRPARQREASCETVVGEDATFISSL